MSTIQFTNLTDKELVNEAAWQMRNQDHGMDLSMQVELLKRFTQYATNERVAYKKIDRNQLELPL
jgi:hypothetical protein